ncbi:FAD-binding domain-containing protein [Roseococcus sp. DSY-14]|uniref:FAD-binding domain-containing protein n=1 Tax=Roseococcus sp. DSY-14 TaxID=3369650 RepID=UPI00387B52A4
MELPDPTRAAGLARLRAFTPRMGAAYAAGRNADPGPGLRQDVARLSAHLRHRLLLEEEVVGAALAAHGPQAAAKFVQEVFWRTYWKGFLQLRPALWEDCKAGLAQDQARLLTNGGLRRAVEQATQGRTGIAPFDAWAAELREQGWLHNHARMWFASIWIFTLRLPWRLGAEHFRLHLADADAASNTLSWRWVAGIQTPGKHYLARAENIARYTGGRFDPRGQLDEGAEPLDEPGPPPPAPLPALPPLPDGEVALLLHEDDLHVESLPPWRVRRIAAVAARDDAAPLPRAWTAAALEDALARAEARWGAPARRIAAKEVTTWADGLPVVTPDIPAGWLDDALAGVAAHRWRRPWDAACWPLARKGFFPFREAIPELLATLDPRPPAC